ncbi:MAG: valine--tRNA ligase [Helicobacteraceae bacterium]
MPNAYDPQNSGLLYKFWEENGFFEPQDAAGDKTFCVMMPPPNITGRLHIGHALTFTLQDIITRYKRMSGFKTLWQPGTDHASIAVENIVEKQLAQEGLTKQQLGREEFLRRVWQWKEKSGADIVHQLRRLGVSPAWSRERFTMDDGLSKAVRKAFVQLYNEGNIFKGNYLVNWCVRCGALSDIEVEYQEHKGNLYYLKYQLDGESGFVTVATTRPETYFGDTALMVNPHDEKNKHLIGKTAVLPLIGTKIPIIADEFVDESFGSGVVKVTPAHDPNDYEVGKRHGLEFKTIFDERGILNDLCGDFSGLSVKNVRSAVIEELQEKGFVEKIEPHVHQVGHCYRCNTVIEPFISKQWFLKKEVAQKAIDLVNAGQTKFHPQGWKNNYDAWMRDLRDWCISRQLYWGHKIPVFYCDACGYETASEQDLSVCPKCGGKIRGDEDVLDTWFSSASWPFSTLGWGNAGNPKTRPDDLKNYYPNSLLITGFDILFFWVARMLMFGVHFLGQVPFKDVYLHALVKDEKGQKMSKSKGNVIDPLEIVDTLGADTLRFTLAALAVQGRDIKLSKEHLTQYRNFANKIFNAKNYLLLNTQNVQDLNAPAVQTGLGKFMLHKFSCALRELKTNLDSYRFNDAALVLYKFFWNDFCDWGIEFAKASPQSVPELAAIFKESLKMLHPFMPFLSEELYQELGGTELTKQTSIMSAPFPSTDFKDEKTAAEFELIIEAVQSLRRAKVPIDMANKTVKKAYLLTSKRISELGLIKKLGKIDELEIVQTEPDGCVSDVSQNLKSLIPTAALDLSEVKARLNAQMAKAQKEQEKLERMLGNENFVKNAPPAVVEANKKNLAETLAQIKKFSDELKRLS